MHSPTAKTAGTWCDHLGSPLWQSPPHPLPSRSNQFCPESFTVQDDFVLPAEFEYRVLASWGDLMGPPGRQFRFGFNCDFTGMVPIPKRPNEYYLIVNHEEVSTRPWLEGAEEIIGYRPPGIRIKSENDGYVSSFEGQTFESLRIDLDQLDTDSRLRVHELARAVLDELGVSILHVRRTPCGGIEVIQDSPLHKKISPIRIKTCAPTALTPSQFSGPVATFLTEPIRGTFSNCSGAVTPWGTFLTCEENIDNHVNEFIDASGSELQLAAQMRFSYKSTSERPCDLPAHILGMGSCLEKPLDGRHYGWVTEINPSSGALTKHSSLGRFRHENAGLRVQVGQPLEAFMGDDRHGGHVWKYVSDQTVKVLDDPSNTNLFHSGSLFAAVFDQDFRGHWIPLKPDTPLARPRPELTASGHLWLPNRPQGGHIAVGDPSAPYAQIGVDEWCQSIADFSAKPFAECTLADLVDPQASNVESVILMDAYAMANAIGATPTARPEDVEVHPQDGSVYIAFTHAGSAREGSPSMLVFPESVQATSRRYGCIMRLQAIDEDHFVWGRFLSSGELNHEGAGFACADNMAFDPQGNLWFTTDVSTSYINQAVQREHTKPGDSNYQGAFGNNSLYMVPGSGPSAGIPFLFAVGPCESELAGPTFSSDGKALILSVQHPGERYGTRSSQVPHCQRTYDLVTAAGPVRQQRQVPLGSNFPSRDLDQVPRPAVVCITPKANQEPS